MVGRATGSLVVGRDPVDLFVSAAPPRRRPLLFRVARHVVPRRWLLATTFCSWRANEEEMLALRKQCACYSVYDKKKSIVTVGANILCALLDYFCCRTSRLAAPASPKQAAVGGMFRRPHQQARDRVDRDSVPDPSHG